MHLTLTPLYLATVDPFDLQPFFTAQSMTSFSSLFSVGLSS